MQKEKPVKLGEQYELRCEAIGNRGGGICKKEGFVIFVDEAKVGKNYAVKITKLGEKYAVGQVVQEL